MNYNLIIPMAGITLLCIIYRIIKKEEKDILNIYLKWIIHVLNFIVCYAIFIVFWNYPVCIMILLFFYCASEYFSMKFRFFLRKNDIKRRYKEIPKVIVEKHLFTLDRIFIFQIFIFYIIYIIEFCVKI